MNAGTGSIVAKVMAVLSRYMPEVQAGAVLSRAQARLGVRGHRPSRQELPQLFDQVIALARPFAGTRAAELARELGGLRALELPPSHAAPLAFEIRFESDISTARIAARDLAERLGARSYVAQRAATVVSELARNIVYYTPGGRVEVEPGLDRRSLIVRAIDGGRGIANLEHVLSGDYISKTGLGAGIRGTQRLADRFEIETGQTGTRIEVEIKL